MNKIGFKITKINGDKVKIQPSLLKNDETIVIFCQADLSEGDTYILPLPESIKGYGFKEIKESGA